MKYMQKSHLKALRACNTGRIFSGVERACNTGRLLSGVEDDFVRDLHEDDELTERQAELLSNLWVHCLLWRQMAPVVIPDVDAGGGAA